ncbi:Ig-like domain-containing protein [Paenibacillus sp. FSL K6-1217]|uniref:Ig-like domain-containing protein n=1 Tax=Paenibacillus sp. FSL K6-1217 TaxID=2921466 RepID=UPI0032502AFA
MSDMSYTTKEKSQFMKVQGGEKKVMKKILSVALSTAMAFSMFASVAFGETAKVTPQQAFDALAAKGVVNGFPDGKAHLEKDLTRGEFAKIVTKLFGLTEVTGKLSYKDKGYTAKNWTVPYVEAVTAAGLMQGQDTVKGIFNYNGKVTVEEVAKVLAIALKLEQPTTTDNGASVWAKGYAQAVINAGLVAKDTNFKANATRSLVVETAYYADQIGKTATLTVASAEAVSPTKVVVTFSDKTTANVELTTALVAGVETTINFKHLEKDYTAKVTLQAPKVVGVTTPNAKQLVIKFNRAIDPETLIENVGGKSTLVDGLVEVTPLSGALRVLPNDADVTLAADGTEAWVTFQNNEYLKGQYTVIVKGEVRTTSNEVIPAFTDLINVNDVVAPSVVSVTSVAKTTTNKVYLKLSEPVRLTGLIAYVNGSAATVSRDAYAPLDEVTLTTATLNSGATYDVSIRNLSDYAGNTITPNPFATKVTVTSDVAAPQIVSLTATGEKKVTVVFNKNMDFNSLSNNIRLLDPNGESKGMFTVTRGADQKTFTLTSPLGKLPDSGTFTGTIVFGAGVKDTLGNTLGSALSQPVTFTKDTTAPTVTSSVYRSGTGIVVKFSEEIVYTGATATLIKESTGISTSLASTTARVSDDQKSLIFNVGSLTGTHTLRLPEGIVKDQSAAGNKLAAVNLAVDGNSASSDTGRPQVVGTATYTEVGSEYRLAVRLQDDNELNINSVRDVNSYTLDNKALPSTAYITIADATGIVNTAKDKTAWIFIPKSSIDKTKSYDLTVSGVVDNSNNGVEPKTLAIELKDGKKPTLDSAVINSADSKTMVLTFSELVKSVDVNDFTFTINNDVVAPEKVRISTIGNATEADRFYVTFLDANNAARDLNANEIYQLSVKVKDQGSSDIRDIAGNEVVYGTSYSVK